VDSEHLLELQADAKGRIQSGRGVLRDVRHGMTPRRIERERVELEHIAAGDGDPARPDLATAPAMPE
jgi:hypothetical protein